MIQYQQKRYITIREGKDMSYAELIQKEEGFDDNEMAEILDFIKLVKNKKKKDSNKIILGVLKNSKFYMSDDFDETPECFKEYM